MAIYRGAGGAGDATNDATSQSILAAQSAQEAAASEAAAASSASSAATSATNAASSATAAASSATSAANSASSATTQAANAASSAATATTKSSEAADSATAAASSATAAATSATNASNSATAAANSATSASNSASAASTSATNAATYASNAATSATNAANSATAAASSATDAQSSEDAAAAYAASINPANFLAKANNLSDLTNTSTARTNLGVAIGTNVQAYSSELQAISNGGGNAMFKNRIINGSMTIDQRNAGTSKTINNDPMYTLDRWCAGMGSNVNAFTVQQSSTVPSSGFTKSLVCTMGTGITISAGGYAYFQQAIEGFNVADFNLGTAAASPFTLSFWVRSSVTGTFGVSFKNNAQTATYCSTYTINAANTWEYKTVTVPAITSGTWTTDNSIGIAVIWDLGVGTTYSGTANQLNTGANYFGVTGTTKLAATTGATFYITGVQLEKGSTATSFDYRPYGTELALCQRYYESYSYNDVAIAAGIPNSLKCFFSFAVAKRTTPTMSLPASTNQGLNKTNGATLTPAYAWTASGTINGFQIYAGDGNIGGFVAGTATASAEL